MCVPALLFSKFVPHSIYQVFLISLQFPWQLNSGRHTRKVLHPFATQRSGQACRTAAVQMLGAIFSAVLGEACPLGLSCWKHGVLRRQLRDKYVFSHWHLSFLVFAFAILQCPAPSSTGLCPFHLPLSPFSHISFSCYCSCVRTCV